MAAFVLLHHSDQIAWIPRPTWADMTEFLKLLTGQGGMLLVVIYLALVGLAFLPSGRETGKRLKPDGDCGFSLCGWCCLRRSRFSRE